MRCEPALLALVALLGCSSPVVEAVCDPRPADQPAAPCVRRSVGGPVASEPLHPVGRRMVLGLYELEGEADMRGVAATGWNVAHSYATTPTTATFLSTCASTGLRALARLAGTNQPIPEADAIADIRRLAASDALLWWDLPEQLRYWRSGEMEIVRSYARLTRAHDPARRPVYMYIPGHYDAAAIAQYVPYLDVIPAAVYPQRQGQPHAWSRWRVESTIEGIAKGGATVGGDHLAGQKTPVAILQLFQDEGDPPPTAAGAFHDLWQALVSGARGVLVASYAKRNDGPELAAAWRRLDEAARLLTGPEALAQAVLDGAPPAAAVSVAVTAGPARTPEFRPWVPDGTTPTVISYPSVDLLARVVRDELVVIAVSSAEAPVQARVTGLHAGATTARLVLQGREVPVTAGALDLAFDPLGVAIVKVALR